MARRRDFVGIPRLVAEEKAKLIGDPAGFGVWHAVVTEADHKTGIVEMSARELADWYGWQRRPVTANLNHLHAAGLIVWDKGRGGADVGRIIVPDYHDCVIGGRATGTATGTVTGTKSRQLDEPPQPISAETARQDVKTLSLARSLDHSLSPKPAISAEEEESEPDWDAIREEQLGRFDATYKPAATGGSDGD